MALIHVTLCLLTAMTLLRSHTRDLTHMASDYNDMYCDFNEYISTLNVTTSIRNKTLTNMQKYMDIVNVMADIAMKIMVIGESTIDNSTTCDKYYGMRYTIVCNPTSIQYNKTIEKMNNFTRIFDTLHSQTERLEESIHIIDLTEYETHLYEKLSRYKWIFKNRINDFVAGNSKCFIQYTRRSCVR